MHTLPQLPWKAAPLLPDVAPDARAIMEAYARLRGAESPADIARFLDPSPQLGNPLIHLPELPRALERVARALKDKETISVFGDFDCDGVTSTVIVRDVLLAAGHPGKQAWCYIPDRLTEDYGLSLAAAKTCFDRQRPSLIIAVDCGSNSFHALEWLNEQGVDTIVLDHHSVQLPEGRHPAYAHLNPKAHIHSGDFRDAATLSAAGLSYFFADALASALDIAAWQRDRALILGGLGTLVDVMPLLGSNRALLKHSLALANSPEGIGSLPGLAALAKATRLREYTPYGFAFAIGPCLNSAGRVDHARSAVQLLSSRRLESAIPLADILVTTNKERRDLQARVLEEATAEASQQLISHPDRRILLLANADWHPGVVGIVAGRIREEFRRPAIIAGRIADGSWKGSARSIPGFDVGALATRAAIAGVVLAGGGHPAAAGFRFTDAQRDPFRDWLDAETRDLALAESEVHHTLARADDLPVDEVAEILDHLGPFGMGNPTPLFFLDNAVLTWGPRELRRKSDNSIWALKAGFHTRRGTLYASWTDHESARINWHDRGTYRMVLRFTRLSTASGVYDEWMVVACTVTAPAKRT